MTLIRLTLALHRALQRLRARDVRDRFDAEERQVLAEDLEERGAIAVVRQWPALLRDGLADAISTRRVSPRDTMTRRAVDLGVAALLAGPALAVTASLAALIKKPAFVVVTYAGRDGNPVRIHKLRTMTVAEPRQVTGLGRVLRRTRLDELPSLLALARGDLTLVGPRPGTATPVRPGLLRSTR